MASLLAGPAANAQDEAVKPGSPTFQTESREVSLDLVVRDKKGRLVLDLQPNEVTVTEDGKPVELRSLRLVRGSSPGDKGKEHSDTKVTPTVTGGEPSTKAGEETDGPKLVTVIVLPLGLEGRRLAQDALKELLKDSDGSTFYGLFRVTAGLQVIQPYTKDVETFKAAAERMLKSGAAGTGNQTNTSRETIKQLATAGKGGDPQSVFDSLTAGSRTTGAHARSGPGVDQITQWAIDMVQSAMAADRLASAELGGRPGLNALMSLVKEQEKVPGRKSILFFSEGLQLSESMLGQFRSIISYANRAGTTIYTVDASGLNLTKEGTEAREMATLAANQSANQTQDGSNTQQTRTGVKNELDGRTSASEIKSIDTGLDSMRANSRTALRELAESTGGFMTANTNEMKKPMQRIVEEIRTHYVVTYLPPPAPLDGSFHKVEMTLSRRDVKVQGRQGYLALPIVPGKALMGFEPPLIAAASGTLEKKDFDFSIKPVAFGRAPNGPGRQYAIAVEVPLQSLKWEVDPKTQTFLIHLQMVALVRDASGEIVGRLRRDQPVRGPLGKMEAYQRGQLAYQEGMSLPAGEYTLQAVVVDKLSGAQSIQRTKFIAEAAPEGIAMSEISLVRRADPANTEIEDGMYLMRKQQITPRLDRRIAGGKGSALPLYMVAYTKQGSTGKPKLTLRMKDGDQTIAETSFPLTDGSAAGYPLTTTLSLENLPGGKYSVEMDASGNGEVVHRSLDFEVLPWEGQPTVSAAAMSHELAEARAKSTEPVVAIEHHSVADFTAPPPSAEQQALLEQTREAVLKYATAMPNFGAVRHTKRYVDKSRGKDRNWTLSDEYSESLAVENGAELLLELQRRSNNEKQVVSMVSSGEFASTLKQIFDPKREAAFRWLRRESLRGRPVEVFAFKVTKDRSEYDLVYREINVFKEVRVGYEGLVWIEPTRGVVLRFTLISDETPKGFPLQGHEMAMDYEFAAIEGVEYLLPMSAARQLKMGRQWMKNEVQFSGFARFDVVTKEKVDKPKEAEPTKVKP